MLHFMTTVTASQPLHANITTCNPRTGAINPKHDYLELKSIFGDYLKEDGFLDRMVIDKAVILRDMQ